MNIPALLMALGGAAGAFLRLLGDKNVDHFGTDRRETIVSVAVGFGSSGLIAFIPPEWLTAIPVVGGSVGAALTSLKTILADKFAAVLFGAALSYSGFDLVWLIRQRLGIK